MDVCARRTWILCPVVLLGAGRCDEPSPRNGRVAFKILWREKNRRLDREERLPLPDAYMPAPPNSRSRTPFRTSAMTGVRRSQGLRARFPRGAPSPQSEMPHRARAGHRPSRRLPRAPVAQSHLRRRRCSDEQIDDYARARGRGDRAVGAVVVVVGCGASKKDAHEAPVTL